MDKMITDSKGKDNLLKKISMASLIEYFRSSYDRERVVEKIPREEKSKDVLKRRKHRKAVKKQKRKNRR